MHTQNVVVIDEKSGISECLERLSASDGASIPLSTYRLQFNLHFRFADALKLVPYLAALGVSTCYASPLLQARAGSMHGYDITDHNKLNPEIGTEEEFQEFTAALKKHDIGLLLDVVPNHMGVGHGTNPWWQDVLENGHASKFANFFDIDWTPIKVELRDKVLLPILGNQYGEELEAGKLCLQYGTTFEVAYYDKILPIDPQTFPLILEGMGDLSAREIQALPQSSLNEFRGLLVAFGDLPPHSSSDAERISRRRRDLPVLLERLRNLVDRVPELRVLIEQVLTRLNGRAGDVHSFDGLHKVLEEQAYRLAHWRVSAEEINYRRFFDVNDLVGLRMEDPQVFAATQKLVRRLLADRSVVGLRIDHPDGLFNPPQYFTRLQMLYAASQCCGAEPRPPLAENGIEAEVQTVFGQHDWLTNRAPLYVIVEKILEPGEELPQDWPVNGTVGYEFANLVNGVFIDQNNRKAFTNLYHRIIGDAVDVDALIYQSKKLIMHSALSSEVNVLGHMLDEISSTDRRARDFTRKSLRDAIRETIACFPVYRTYIDERGNITERDRGYIDEAIGRAKRRNGNMAPQVFDYLQTILLLRANDSAAPIYGYKKQLYFALKFQQLTGPVMAKGLEDTVCYVYNRFVSVNEVGGSPKQFGVTLDEFHRANLERAAKWPHSMLLTSSHDTKRSEDVRMRLDVLSEMPRTWTAQVMRWRRANRLRKRALSDDRTVPDANEEYLLYQTLVGAWPLPQTALTQRELPKIGGPESKGTRAAEPFDMRLAGEQREEFIARVQDYMTKAVHEAKVNLSWVNQDAEYVEALRKFIARTLSPGSEAKPNAFLQQIEQFLPRIAFFGALNSLAQALLKFTVPGVPDVYQGQELWDLSLVDPDNRRPVDFKLRERYANELLSKPVAEHASLCDQMLRAWHDGRCKLWVTQRALQLRRKHRALFHSGSYAPVYASGPKMRHVLAFERTNEQQMSVTVVPRFSYTMMNGELQAPLGGTWADTKIEFPSNVRGEEFVNVLTGETLRIENNALSCADIFRRFPVALLIKK